MPTPLSPLRALLVLVVLSAPLAAQEREPYVEESDRPAVDEQAHAGDDPGHAFEFAIGGDALSLGYRNGLHRGAGYFTCGFLANEDDDWALQARILRFAEPSAETPLGLGLGLGLFGAFVDETNDELAAITITGAADFALDRVLELTYPTRVGLELSYAPDAATFADGNRVLDVLARVETDLSSWATAFAGYRHLEVDIEDEDDPELDSALHIGVRIGF